MILTFMKQGPILTLTIQFTNAFLNGSLHLINHMAITWWASDTMYKLNLRKYIEKKILLEQLSLTAVMKYHITILR